MRHLLTTLFVLALVCPSARAAEADFDCPRELSAPGYCGDKRRAAKSGLDAPVDVVAAGDGSLLVVDSGNGVIRRIGADGLIRTTVPAVGVRSIALLPDGGRLVLDPEEHQIQKDDDLERFAGYGEAGYVDDADPKFGFLRKPHDMAVAADGTVVIADTGNHRVRAVRPGAGLVTLAGNGRIGTGGDGGPATSAQLDRPRAVAAMPDGSVVVATAEGRLRQILGDGTIRRIGTADFGAGVTLAALPDGAVAVGDASARRVLKVSMDGSATVLAQGGGCGTADAKRAPSAAGLNLVSGLAALPDGSVVVADAGSHRVLRLTGSAVKVVAGGGLRPRRECLKVPELPRMEEQPEARPPLTAEERRQVVHTVDGGSTKVETRGSCHGRRGRGFDVSFSFTRPGRIRAGRAFQVAYNVGVNASLRVEAIGRVRRSSTAQGGGLVLLRLPGLPAGRYSLRFAASAKGQRLCLRTNIRVR